MRSRAISYLPDTRAIIFVVDCAPFRAREAAEHLYELLSNRQVRQLKLPFIVALNKADLHSAQAVDVVRPELEREMCGGDCLFLSLFLL